MEHRTDTGLPASFEAAWGIRERPGKAPGRGLSLPRIIDAAVRLAAAEGLAAASMNRVASELGTSPMSLYRYVASKDELLALMMDAAFGPPPGGPGSGHDWRAGLSLWAQAYLAVLRRHPWVLRISIDGPPPPTPNQLAWLDTGLDAFHDTDLDEAEKMSAVLLLIGFIRSPVHQPPSTGNDTAGALPEGRSFGEVVANLVDAKRFPAITRAIGAGVLGRPDDPSAEFSFGLERILDGLDALIRRRAADTSTTDAAR